MRAGSVWLWCARYEEVDVALRVGILGCGRMSRNHAKAIIAHPDAELAALADVDTALIERWVAESKFGPNYVVCKTPLDNVRTTTFFAGEHEVRIIDPRRVELVEAHGCRVVVADGESFDRETDLGSGAA